MKFSLQATLKWAAQRMHSKVIRLVMHNANNAGPTLENTWVYSIHKNRNGSHHYKSIAWCIMYVYASWQWVAGGCGQMIVVQCLGYLWPTKHQVVCCRIGGVQRCKLGGTCEASTHNWIMSFRAIKPWIVGILLVAVSIFTCACCGCNRLLELDHFFVTDCTFGAVEIYFYIHCQPNLQLWSTLVLKWGFEEQSLVLTTAYTFWWCWLSCYQ